MVNLENFVINMKIFMKIENCLEGMWISGFRRGMHLACVSPKNHEPYNIKRA